MNRQLLILVNLFVLTSIVVGQVQKRDPNISFDCVLCHVSWQNGVNGGKSLLPELDAPIQIEGRPAHAPTQAMCFSCHDGTIMDSRQVFRSSNHGLGMNQSEVQVKGLPLDKDGKIYCGTCHTPHSLKPERSGGLSPFLRKEIKNSDLCISCHQDHSSKHINHPIHVAASPDHNMPENTFFGGDNSIECMTCHPIHGEQSTWGVAGGDRRELCSSCHDTYFNIELTDHDLATTLKSIPGAAGPSLGEQDACATCHASHGGNGRLMWAVELSAKDGENSYCLGCHNLEGLAQNKAFPHEGHAVTGKSVSQSIPALGLSAGEEIRCVTCHDPHQWEFSKRHAVTEANEEGTEYTSFLRLPDDAQGQLCIACHSQKAQIIDSDHSVVREGFQQHFRNNETFRGQCSACHETHGKFGYKTVDDGSADVTRQLCESCHSVAHYPTTVGGMDHPLEIPIEEDLNIPDFNGTLTCISCHDPHIWGTVLNESKVADLEGNDRNSFLRIDNWPSPDLCVACHEDQEVVLETHHDLGDRTNSACSVCHSAHNAKAQHGLLNYWETDLGDSYNEHFCFSCHQEGEIGENKIPEEWTHPHQYGTVSLSARGTGEWIDFPLFSETQPQEDFGFIDCFTCHNPHRWSFNEDDDFHDKYDEGNYLTSFLRNPSHETLCIDCHGQATIWKFNYYHDPVKRKRY